MNSEELINLAAEAIAQWSQHHDASCVLFIENGSVVARKLKVRSKLHPPCLNVSKFRQRTGFSSAEWHTIGNALFTLYNK